MVHVWWCSITFQPYSLKICGQHIHCLREDLTSWLLCSPDLNPIAFYMLGQLKTLFYTVQLHLVAERLYRSKFKTCQQLPRKFWTCLALSQDNRSALLKHTAGRYFKHLLWKYASSQRIFGTFTMRCPFQAWRGCNESMALHWKLQEAKGGCNLQRRLFWTHDHMNVCLLFWCLELMHNLCQPFRLHSV
jgi:hypothetical protein